MISHLGEGLGPCVANPLQVCVPFGQDQWDWELHSPGPIWGKKKASRATVSQFGYHFVNYAKAQDLIEQVITPSELEWILNGITVPGHPATEKETLGIGLDANRSMSGCPHLWKQDTGSAQGLTTCDLHSPPCWGSLLRKYFAPLYELLIRNLMMPCPMPDVGCLLAQLEGTHFTVFNTILL